MVFPQRRGETSQEREKVEGTYDFADPVEQMKAIDQAMRHYFAAENWVQVRDRKFPGLRYGS